MSVIKLSKKDIIKKEDEDNKIKLKRNQMSYDSALVSVWESGAKKSFETLQNYNTKLNNKEYLSSDDIKSYKSAIDSYIENNNRLRGLNKTFGQGYTEDEEKQWNDSVSSLQSGYKAVSDYFSPYKTEDEYNDAKKIGELYDMSLEEIAPYLDSDDKIAYTTSSNQNITWQSLYEKKKEEENFNERYKDYSSRDDWGEHSQYKITYDEDNAWSMLTDADWEYEAANRITGHGAASSGGSAVDNAGYADVTTNEEKEIFNYIYHTEGKEAAMEWHKSRENIYKDRREGNAIGTAISFAEDYPVFSDAVAIAGGVVSAGEYLVDLFHYAATGELDDNQSAKVSSAIKATRMEQIDWEVGEWDVFDFLYGTTTSMAESMASMAMFGGAGGVALGLSTAAQSTNDALNRGMSKGQAFVNGVASGIFEGLFESWSIGAFGDLTKNLKRADFRNLAKYIGKNMWNNAKEETLTEIANIVYDTILNGEFSQAETSIRQLMASGMSESDAKKQVAIELGGQVVEAGASGALMGFGFGTGGAISTAYRTAKAGNALKNEGKVGSLVDLGKTLGEGTESYDLVSKINDKSSGLAIGSLLGIAEDEVLEANRGDVVKSLERKGYDTKKASRLADLMLNPENNMFANSHGVTPEGKTYSDILNNPNSTANQRTQAYLDIIDSLEKAQESKKNKSSKSTPNLSTISQADTKETLQTILPYSNEYVNSMVKDFEAMGMPTEHARIMAEKKLSTPTEDNSSPTEENFIESKFEVSADGKTVNTKTDKIVNIKNIDSISESGEANLTLDDGMVVKASDIAYGNNAEAVFIENIGKITIGENPISTTSANALYMTAMEALKGNPNMTASEAMSLIKGLTESYIYGTYNLGRSKLTARNEDGTARLFAGELSQEQRKYAYELGTQDSISKTEADQKVIDELKAKAEGKTSKKTLGKVIFEKGAEVDESALTETQKANLNGIKLLAEISSVEFHVFHSDKTNNFKHTMPDGTIRSANGWFVAGTNEIWIDLNAGNAGEGTMIRTAAHEISHYIKQWSPQKWRAMADLLMKSFAENGVDTESMLNRQIAKIKKRYKANKEAMPSESKLLDMAHEELVSDALSDMLTDGSIVNFIAEVKAKDMRLAKKILNAIKSLLKKWGLIIDDYKGRELDTPEAQALSQLEDTFKKLQEMYQEAFMDANETVALTDIVNIDADSKSVSPIMSERTSNRTFSEEFTAETLNSFGIKKLDDSIHVQRQVLDTLLNEEFFTDIENRRRVDVNKESGLVIETNKSGIDETFSFNNFVRLGKFKKIAKLTTIRELPNIIKNGHLVADNVANKYDNAVKNKKFAYIEYTTEVDEKKVVVKLAIKKSPQKNKFWVHSIYTIENVSSSPASTNEGTEAGHITADTEDILPQDTKSVKMFSDRDSEGHTLSKEQQDFFANSKVRDAEGNLIPVYHGTYENFTIFDINKTANANIFGKGHYFTSSEEDAHNNYASREGGDVKTKIDSLAYYYFEEMGCTEEDLYDNDHIEEWNKAYDRAEEFYESGKVMKVYLNITNPVYANDTTELYDKDGNFISARSIEGLKKLGFDGIIDYNASEKFDFQHLDNETAHYVVFNSNQIKETTNKTPTTDPNIRYSFRDSESGMANDLLSPYNEELTRFIQQRGDYIVDSFKKLEEIVNLAFDNPSLKATAYFGIVDVKTLEKIKSSIPNLPQASKDILFKKGQDYSIATTLDSIRHIVDEKSLSREDVLDYLDRLADTVVEFDSVAFDYYQQGNNKLKGLLFKKKFSDGTLVSFNIVSHKKRSVMLQSLYLNSVDYQKKKSAETLPMQNAPAHTPEVQVSRTSNNSISQDSIKSQEKFSYRNNSSDFDSNIGYTYRADHFSYYNLIKKPDMKLTRLGGAIPKNRADVVYQAKKNAASVGKANKNGNVSVFVDDVGTEVVLATKGLSHGLRRIKKSQTDPNFAVTLKAGEIIKNSIKINEILPSKKNASGSYVLIGVANNPNGDLYIVRSVVNQFNHELDSIDILYAINAKKEELAATKSPRLTAKPLSDTSSAISVADLLDYVNKYFPDILPESVLKHYKHTERPKGDLGESALFSDRDSSTSNRSILANALEGVAQNDIEKNKLAEYKEKISLIESEEQRLSEIQKQLFTKGGLNPTERKELQFEAKQIANRINTYDRQLLKLEATKPLQNVLTREKELARKKQKQKDNEYLKQYKEKVAKTTRELITRNQESRKKAMDSRHRTAMREKIKKTVNELNTLLLKGSKERNIKLGLQAVVAEALEIINMDTVGADERVAKYDALIAKATDPDVIESLTKKRDRIQTQGEKLADKLEAMRNAYAEIRRNSDKEYAQYYQQEAELIEYVIADVIEKVGNTSIRNMTLPQLEAVYNMYKVVLQTVRYSNELYTEGKVEELRKNASSIMVEIEKLKTLKEERAVLGDKFRGFSWNVMIPVYAFKRIGSNTLERFFWEMIRGQNTFAEDIKEANDFASATRKKYGYNKWDLDKVHEFKLADGRTFRVTLRHMMSIYAYSKREQALDHMAVGGFFFNDKSTFRRKGGMFKLIKSNEEGYSVDQDVLKTIISAMEKEAKGSTKYVDEMQDYLTKMGEKGNEVSRVVWGIDIFKEKIYFPLKSSRDFIFQANQTAQETSLKHDGMTKETKPGASNPIILEAFDDVWASHINRMSQYHGFVIPIDNMNKLLNYGSWVGTTSVSVSTMLRARFGEAVNEYLNQFIKDMNGASSTSGASNPFFSFVGKFKKTAVAASTSVVVQQPTAILRALAVMDAKYFIGLPEAHLLSTKWSELQKYAPITTIKEIGGFDAGVGRQASEWLNADTRREIDKISSKIDDITMKGAAIGDQIGWCAIWEAVKREIKATTNLKAGSEEFLKKAGERFTEVIVLTQVYDSTLSRSGFMRSKHDSVKMLTAFMGEPTVSINMMYDAMVQAKRKTITKRKAGRIIGATYVSIITASAAASLIYALRDDDEDESYLEKFAEALGGKLVGDINPLNMLPGVRDLISIFDGWDVERTDMAVFKDIKDAFDGLFSENKSATRKIEDFAGAVASIFGVPLKNLLRTGREIYNGIKSIFDDITPNGVGDAFVRGITGEKKDKGEDLYNAIVSGDKSRLEIYRKGYKDDKEYETAVRKALRENDSRIREAAEARKNGNASECFAIVGEIVDEGHFSRILVISAVNAELGKIKKSEK